MKKIYVIALTVLMASCASEDSTLDIAGMFSPNGEVVGTRFAQSMAYNDSVGEIHLDMHADDYAVYVCTDSHITRKTHRNLDYFMDQYILAPMPKLALHLGDLIDAQRQWSEYRQYFKTSAYWFDTNNGAKKLDLFICLDSAEGTLGIDQMNWLKDLLAKKSKEGYRRIVVFTHTHIWKLDESQGHTSNMALEETYELTSLLGQYGVEVVWCGHQHAMQRVEFKNVLYLVLNATKDEEKGQSYMIAEMGKNINYTFIEYPKK